MYLSLKIFDINMWKHARRAKAVAHKCGSHQVQYGSCTALCQRPTKEQWISATDIRFTALVLTNLSTFLYTLLQTNGPPLLPALFSLLCSLSQTKVYKIHMYIISPIKLVIFSLRETLTFNLDKQMSKFFAEQIKANLCKSPTIFLPNILKY